MNNKTFSKNIIYTTKNIWLHRHLIIKLTKHEILKRYKGSVLGVIWALITPLTGLAIYTVVFSVIFKARWGTEIDDRTTFATLLFSGLIVFNIFTECITKCPNVIVDNLNYVKKFIFPLEVLPIVVLFSALFHASASIFILLLLNFYTQLYIPYTIVFLPLVLFPFLLVTLGCGWFLSGVGVFIRDMQHVITIFSSALLFLSPIFYPVTILPQWLQDFTLLNPLVFIIEQMRSVLIFGQLPNLIGLVIYTCISFLTAALGLYLFQKLRHLFYDVI